MTKGSSIADAIVIDAHGTIAGVTEEINYINQLCRELQTGIEAIEQKLIFENNRQYDGFTLTMVNGNERILYFDVTTFFGKI